MSPLDSPLWAEQAMRCAVTEAGYRRRIVEAGGLHPEALSEQSWRILAGLCGWDEWTTGGVVELLAAGRTAGALPEDRARQRQQAAVREESAAIDAVVFRYWEYLEGRR